MTGLIPPHPAPTAEALAETASRTRGLLLVALAAVLWSTGGLIVRSLDSADVWTTVFWRSVFAAGFLGIFIAVRDRRRAIEAFRTMGRPGHLVAVCFAISSVCLVLALSLTSVANTLVILSTSPLIAAVLGRLILGEQVRGRSWLAMAAAIVGVAIMVSESSGRGSWSGNLVALVIAIGLALATVTIRKHRHVRMTPSACLAAVLSALAAAPLAHPWAVTGGDFALLAVFGAVQLGAGLALYVTGARLAPAAEVALVSVLEPILGPIWVWVVLDEHPGAATLIGGGIVLGALAIHMALDMRRARPIPPAI